MALISDLVTQIDSYLGTNITLDELEDYTMGVINSDEFEKIPEGLQDRIV